MESVKTFCDKLDGCIVPRFLLKYALGLRQWVVFRDSLTVMNGAVSGPGSIFSEKSFEMFSTYTCGAKHFLFSHQIRSDLSF